MVKTEIQFVKGIIVEEIHYNIPDLTEPNLSDPNWGKQAKKEEHAYTEIIIKVFSKDPDMDVIPTNHLTMDKIHLNCEYKTSLKDLCEAILKGLEDRTLTDPDYSPDAPFVLPATVVGQTIKTYKKDVLLK